MRICLVASEILGAHKNGGIGTATSNLAYFFAKSGYQVDVVYVGEGRIDYSHPWALRLTKIGVTLTHLDIHQKHVFPAYMRETTTIYDYLSKTDFELVIFQDWRGGAFSCIQARNAGLAFARTRLAVVAHGPTEWLLDANRTIARSQETLAHLHMEKTAFEGADVVLCPSRHMKSWIKANQYNVKHMIHIPLYLWVDQATTNFVARQKELTSVTTLAYFGRLEDRKGIAIFVNALLDDRFAYSRFNVHFVGKEASWNEDQIRNYLTLRRPWLSSRLHFYKDLDSDQSQTHLIEHDCLAIIPSLVDNAPCVISECLRRQIPFLSTTSGGIPELIVDTDRDRVLFAPTAKALADKLDVVLNRPFAPARSEYQADDVGQQWLTWLTTQEPVAAANVATETAQIERVTVVLTHYERPHLVNQTLAALAVQTYRHFDVILVDDGSKKRRSASKP